MAKKLFTFMVSQSIEADSEEEARAELAEYIENNEKSVTNSESWDLTDTQNIEEE